MTLLRRAITAGCVSLAVTTQLQSQVLRAIDGTVRSSRGALLDYAVVVIDSKRAVTDSLGRFEVTGLSGDSVRIRIRRIGFLHADTTLTLRGGARTRLDVTLVDAGFERIEAEANALNAANGRTDSSARGLLRAISPIGASPLTFDSFGYRFLDAAVRGQDAGENVVVSPVSAGLALGLALHGARGATERALASALGSSSLDRKTLILRGTSLLAATSGRSDVQLEIANGVWVDSTAILTTSFAASARAWHATPVTLRLASPAALDIINRWADNATHGKIHSIFDSALPPSTKVVIANAVYFKGKWLAPFEKASTALRDFTLASGTQVRVPTMTRTGNYAYRRDSTYQTVRLPYRWGRAAMYIVLPDSGVRIDALLQRFTSMARPASLGERDMRLVQLQLPKLHVEASIDLLPVLERLGAGIAMDCGRADFGDLATSRSNGDGLELCIGSAVQKVYLDLDEEGTEAAAVTGMAISATAAPQPLPFIVNRPFLFILRDEVTGADLFLGRIGRP